MRSCGRRRAEPGTGRTDGVGLDQSTRGAFLPARAGADCPPVLDGAAAPELTDSVERTRGCLPGLEEVGDGTQSSAPGTEPEACAPGPVASSPGRWGRKARPQVSPGQLPRSRAPAGKVSWACAPWWSGTRPWQPRPAVTHTFCQQPQLLDLNRLPVASRLRLGLW